MIGMIILTPHHKEAEPLSFDYFADRLTAGSVRDRLLYIAGQLSAFDDLFGSWSVDNQPGTLHYDSTMPQGVCVVIYSETDPEPDTGHYFTCYADGTVRVMQLMSYPAFKDGEIDKSQPRELCREDSTTTLSQLMLWLRSQPPSINTILS